MVLLIKAMGLEEDTRCPANPGTHERRGCRAQTAANAALITPHPFSAHAGGNQAHLRIMETTDLHVNVLPYDYYADIAVDTVGLARTAALIAQSRAEATNSLLLDNGDFLQGNPMGDYIAYARGMQPGDLHPIIAAMNVLGYDAATLGNHEFNYGLEFLLTALDGAAFPFVSANLARKLGASPRQDQTLIAPYVLLDRMITDGTGAKLPIRIGLIGFVPPQIVQWDRRHLEGRVVTRDILATATAYVPQMKEAGADIIIALSHSGIGPANASNGMENASTPLARLAGIDAVVTGHSHLVFPSPGFQGFADVDVAAGTIGGKPAVMAGFWGSHLGLIDLLLHRDGGRWSVISTRSEARPIARRNADRSMSALVPSAPAVLAAVQRDHAATLAYVRRPVGRTTAPLHSYFALVAGDATVHLVATAQRWYLARMLQGTAEAGLPILSAVAPFKTGGRAGPEFYTDIPAGDLALRNVADLYIFPNTFRAVKITGAHLHDWLERSAGIFNQITPGQPDQPLLNPDFPSYNFDVITGISYQIDISQPSKYGPCGALLHAAANRIKALSINGAPLNPAAEFIIATNNYRADGGGDFPGAAGDTIIFCGPDTNRDIVLRYIAEKGSVTPVATPSWRFAPLPGTSVLFDTGPKAAAHLAEVQAVQIELVGDGPDGFTRFRMRL